MAVTTPESTLQHCEREYQHYSTVNITTNTININMTVTVKRVTQTEKETGKEETHREGMSINMSNTSTHIDITIT